MKLFLFIPIQIKADSDYILRVLQVSGVKRYRPNKNCIGLVRFCSIGSEIELAANCRCSILFDCRTQSNTNRSIEFLFDFVRLDTPG